MYVSECECMYEGFRNCHTAEEVFASELSPYFIILEFNVETKNRWLIDYKSSHISSIIFTQSINILPKHRQINKLPRKLARSIVELADFNHEVVRKVVY